MQDWRFVGLAAVATLAVVVDPRSTLKDPVVRVLAAMLVPSFVVWIVTFGIYRYFVFGEILASALFGVLVLRLIHEPTRAAAVCLGSLVFGTAFQIAPNWGRDAELTTESLRRVSASIESEMPVILLDAGPPASYMLNEFRHRHASLVPGRFARNSSFTKERSSRRSTIWSTRHSGSDRSTRWSIPSGTPRT